MAQTQVTMENADMFLVNRDGDCFAWYPSILRAVSQAQQNMLKFHGVYEIFPCKIEGNSLVYGECLETIGH